jgi:cell division protein FtsL
MIVLVVVLVLFYVGNRYVCLRKLREIDRLQQELKDSKYEAVTLSSQLTGSNRQSQVEELVKSLGLDLESAKAPPYILHK